jgi:TolA-binding protein
MRPKLISALMTALIVACVSVAPAQSDAKKAFEAGKEAFAAGQFDKARELFAGASQVDVKNPEAFLWLGKACYQLGLVDEAMEAWTRTLALAPEEAYAKRMLAALKGQTVNPDVTLSVIETMLREKLWDGALAETNRLLGEKALTDAQRLKAMMLKAHTLLWLNRPREVVPTVQELLARFGKQADRAWTDLFLGSAYLKWGAERSAEGVALLTRVASDHAATPAGVLAQYELIVFELSQAATAARIDALAKWIGANPEHAEAPAARMLLLEKHLERAVRTGPAPTTAPLAAEDQQALAVAGTILKATVRADEADKLVRRLLAHIDERYGKRGAYAAAVAATDAVVQMALPRSSRSLALRAAAKARADGAIRELSQTLATGATPRGDALPPALAQAVAALEAITKEFPDAPAWKEQAALAAQVRDLSGLVQLPAGSTMVEPPLQWSVLIALPVVGAGVDDAAAASAIATVDCVIAELSGSSDRSRKLAAIGFHTQVLTAMGAGSPLWENALWRQVELLDGLARFDFTENARVGKADLNATLTDPQKQLLANLAALVKKQAALAPRALDRLAAHLAPWIAAGQDKLVEGAYAELEKALPEAQQPQAKLAVVALRIGRITREHERLMAAGLAPDRKLDPELAKSLATLYAMQQNLRESDALLATIRTVWNGVVYHYKRLEYYEAAEAAVKVSAEPKVALADAYAQYQLAKMLDEAAWRDLEQVLAQRDGAKRLALTAPFKAAIEAYQKIIVDQPGTPQARQAVGALFRIAGTFSQHEADAVAAQIYRDFAAFAAKQKSLSTAAPGTASVADQAAFAAAGALETKARRAMAKALAARKADQPPPAALSEEWAAAIAAYKEIIKADLTGAFVLTAVQKITGAATEYAKVDAWDVADGVFADLLGSGLAIRQPERLEFCRGLCQAGKAMPDHARQVLAMMSAPPPVTQTQPSGPPATRPAGHLGGGGAAAPKPRPDNSVTAGNDDNGITSGFEVTPPGEGWADKLRADDLTKLDYQTLATIHQLESHRAAQVALLREQLSFDGRKGQGIAVAATPGLSDAELERIDAAIGGAYKIFQSIRTKYAPTVTAQQARVEILAMVTHWRGLGQWQRSAALVSTFLKDNPNDAQVPQLRLQIARDYLAWASGPLDGRLNRQAMLGEAASRFEKARQELLGIIAVFTDEKPLVQQAQWDLASSFLTQARVVEAISPTLARGQYVRAAKELRRIAAEYYEHPNIAQIPQMMWNIAADLAGRGYFEEAITVFGDLANFDPATPMAEQAAQQIAQIYQGQLQRPLRAVETYLEINFARGGTDVATQNAIFQIGAELRNNKRWVEALHVLEVFVDSFPRHANAGQALTMIGQIHQANEAWEDAIAAYKRVINEYAASGAWVQEARWSITDCIINLSQWRQAMTACEDYIKAYPGDARVAEATRRISVLKDIDRHQTLVNEDGPKAYDAQFQIGSIVRNSLGNTAKAIIEYRKVAENYPKSHLADDALFAIGQIHLQNNEVDKARLALFLVAERYPTSNFADDALFLVGQSFERESVALAGQTRGATVTRAREEAQKKAYQEVSQARNQYRADRDQYLKDIKAGGKRELVEMEEARYAANENVLGQAQFELAAQRAEQNVEALTATQLADRQDKINAALRRAVDSYRNASKVPQADKAGDSLLRMSVIYDEQLKDSKAAVDTWVEIVRQFGGRAVAEEATWRLAQYYEREGDWARAIEHYKSFLSDYRRSARAGAAAFAVAEAYEHLSRWNEAKDAYQNYISNFPDGPMAQKAREQIQWIEKYRL